MATFSSFDQQWRDVDPVSLSYFEDSLYFTDKRHNALFRLQNSALEEVLTLPREPGGMAAYNKDRKSGEHDHAIWYACCMDSGFCSPIKFHDTFRTVTFV